MPRALSEELVSLSKRANAPVPDFNLHTKNIKFFAIISYTIFLAIVLLTTRSYGEKSIVTDVSTLQLALCSSVSSIISVAVLRQKGSLTLYKGLIWIAIAFGCAYLAMDDAFMYHERLDRTIHSLLGWEETSLSDRIDDILVGIYGVIGIAFIFLNRNYFSFSPRFIKYAKLSFSFCILMVFCDSRGFGLVDNLRPLLFHLEEWTKLLGGACLLIALLCALEDVLIAKKMQLK